MKKKMNKLAYFEILLYSGITPFLHLENLADLKNYTVSNKNLLSKVVFLVCLIRVFAKFQGDP